MPASMKPEIDALFSDPNYVDLVQLSAEQRLLFITDLTETRVSAFLGWLFKPNEGHGLGDQAFRALLINVWRMQKENNINKTSCPSPTEMRGMTFRDILVFTEHAFLPSDVEDGNNKRRLDILIVSPKNKIVVAIENKFGTKAGANQLDRYAKYIDGTFNEYKKILVYLDPNEEPDRVDAGWTHITYDWLINEISLHQKSGLLSIRALDALSQVKDYLENEGNASAISEIDRDIVFDAIVREHSVVLGIFERLRKEKAEALLSKFSALDNAIPIPLLVEYIQRKRIWNQILSQKRFIEIRQAIKIKLKSDAGSIEVKQFPTRLLVHLKEWSKFENQTTEPEFRGWGPRISAKVQNEEIFVRGFVNIENIKEEFKDRMRNLLCEMVDGRTIKALSDKFMWINSKHASMEEAANELVEQVLKVKRKLSELG